MGFVGFTVLPELIGLALLAVLDDGKAKYVALGASLFSLVMLPFFSAPGAINWFSFGNIQFQIAMSAGALNELLLWLVAVLAPIVLFYSFGFITLPSEQKRYYAEMLIFVASMLLVAMSASFITLFIGWEMLSVSSYLLVGFWYFKEKATKAARSVISTVLIGDIALFASLVIIGMSLGSFNFSALNAHASLALRLASLLLLVALFVKSAQFPFHEWLSDAMEGPAPVSAMLHSATMVKAGVFVAMLLFPFFLSLHVSSLMLVFGLITAFIATFNAMRETHIKKVLAYSTIQELSLMFVAIGSNALLAAAYFFLIQSFYKALLFFSSGVIMNATGKESLKEVSGLSSNKLAFITTIFGVLSLAGFVPFSGFFASIGISSSLSSNMLVYALISLLSFFTSFFIFRWFAMCAKPARTERERLLYLGLPKSMLASMSVLAAFTLLASVLALYLPGLLKSAPYMAYNLPHPTPFDAIIAMLAISAGSLVSLFLYRKGELGNRLNAIQTTKEMKAFYAYVAYFFMLLGEGVYLFDYLLSSFFDFIGVETSNLGNAARKLATGNVLVYALLVVLALLVVVLVVR
jgi:NADH-quinone oxidoreductase subunit L